MPTAINVEQRKSVVDATEDLAVAQREVERVMLELTADTPRAQKTIITDSLRVAFERLSAARQKLTALAHDGEEQR